MTATRILDTDGRSDEPHQLPAVLVDVDGTLALAQGGHLDQEPTVAQDATAPDTLAVVHALLGAGHRIIVVSGRMEHARRDTLAWLEHHLQVPVDALYLRRVRDRRADAHIKHDL